MPLNRESCAQNLKKYLSRLFSVGYLVVSYAHLEYFTSSPTVPMVNVSPPEVVIAGVLLEAAAFAAGTPHDRRSRTPITVAVRIQNGTTNLLDDLLIASSIGQALGLLNVPRTEYANLRFAPRKQSSFCRGLEKVSARCSGDSTVFSRGSHRTGISFLASRLPGSIYATASVETILPFLPTRTTPAVHEGASSTSSGYGKTRNCLIFMRFSKHLFRPLHLC